MNTVTLFRPVGPKELELIKELGWRGFPPRLEHQPIFYPVLNLEYASRIAREWNVPESGSGYVTKFAIDEEYFQKFEVHNVGGEGIDELWIPAEKLDQFNKHIVGKIEVVAEFHADR
jgi:hypothetical protein